MKKIFTLFAALAMVMSMSAATWTVAGEPAAVFHDQNWSCNAAANDMVQQADGTFKWERTDLSLAANTTIKFKVCKDHGWTTAYPGNDYELKIQKSGLYTITITFNPSGNTVNATATLLEEQEVIATVAVKGAWDSWSKTTAFTLAEDKKTAATTISIAETGEFEFGLEVSGGFIAEKNVITREANVAEGLDSNTGNMKLTVDVAGDYTFTWEYATKNLTVTYPALPAPEYTVTVADATVTTGQWSIDLAGTWEERTVTVKLWQDNVQGFGEYAANAETGYTCQLTNPYADLTPTTAGVYADNGDGTFTFTATMTDAEGGIYNISVTGAIPADEPEINWIEMPLEITNLATMEMPVEGVTYLQLTGRDDMNDADVMLFLNNYTGEEKAYEVNVESSSMTFGGSELKVIDGSITKSVDPELGDVYAGTVHASMDEDGQTMYVEFALKMYALPAIEIEIEDVTITVDWDNAIATFATTWEDAPLSVEVSGFEEAELTEYPECWLTIGDDVNWVDAAAGPVSVIIEDGVATLEGEFTSYATGKSYNVTLTGKLPAKPQDPTALDNLNTTVAPAKVIVNGQLVILKDGVKYNAQGAQL